MNIETAKFILNQCVREELRDHAVGDVEVYWFFQGKEIAGGYFGGTNHEIWMTPKTTFEGSNARELLKCGTLGVVERNDETGPDDFTLGYTMRGLTLQGVREELTGG